MRVMVCITDGVRNQDEARRRIALPAQDAGSSGSSYEISRSKLARAHAADAPQTARTWVECQAGDGSRVAAQRVEQLPRAHTPQEHLKGIARPRGHDLAARLGRHAAELDGLGCCEGAEVAVPA